MSAEAFVTHARSLIGTRWRHRGRKPWAVDCIGLIVMSLDAAGMDWPEARETVRYGRDPWDDQLRKALRVQFGDPVKDRQAGDIALIRWGRGEPSHVAILGSHPNGGLTLIHAHSVHGVVEQSLSGPFLDCLVEIYRPWRA